MPLIQVNLNSATTEELFERLAWFYATAHQVQIYDAEGHDHPLSLATLVNLSRGKIPFHRVLRYRSTLYRSKNFSKA